MYKKITRYILPAFFWSAVLFSIAAAKDIAFEISVDPATAAPGEGVELHLRFRDNRDIPPLDIPRSDGFQVRYLGPSTQMTIINGQTSSSLTHMYSIIPLKAGAYKIGPLRFELNGDTYTSNTLELRVADQPAALRTKSSGQEDSDAASAGLNDRILLVMQAQKNKVYLNEIVPVAVKLLINGVPVRDVQFPQVRQEWVSLAPFAQPRQYRSVIGGVSYDVLEFTTTFFALKQGEFKLGPAQLSCNLLARSRSARRGTAGFPDFFDSGFLDDFFGGYQTHPVTVSSAEIPVTVMAPPQEGRPADFRGATGNFSMKVSAAPDTLKAGDPVTLKITIEGDGNFNTVVMPALAMPADFKVYEPAVKQEDNRKIFEQVVIPMNEKVKEIPAVSFSFFDTHTGGYRTLTEGPFPLTVAGPDKDEHLNIVDSPAQSRRAAAQEELGRDIVFIKDDIGRLMRRKAFLYRHPVFPVMRLLPLAVFAGAMLFRRRRMRVQNDVRYARNVRAPRAARKGVSLARRHYEAGRTEEFYDVLFQTLKEYLGDRFHLPSAGLTIDVVENVLQGRKIAGDIVEKLRDLFRGCDMARYAASACTKEKIRDDLKKLEETLAYLQRCKV